MADRKEMSDAYLALKCEGFGLIEAIRTLRARFELSLVEAKSLCVETDTGRSLMNIQGDLVPVLDEVVARLEPTDDRK